MVRDLQILRPVLTPPEWPDRDRFSCGQCILGSSPETAVDASSAPLRPCSDPHSTPAHPSGKSDLWVSRKTPKANVLALRPDVHSWAAPPPTIPPCGSRRDFWPQGKGPPAGDFQSLSVRPQAARRGSLGLPQLPLPPGHPRPGYV